MYRGLFYIPAALFLVYPVAGYFEYFTQGDFNHTGYPLAVVYLFWYGLVFMGVMLNWLLLHDILKHLVVRFSGNSRVGILRRFASSGRTLISRRFARAFLIVAGLTVIYTAGKMVGDTRRIVVENLFYELPGTAGLAEPFTIVHIADLHADKYTGKKKMNRYVDIINESRPDIVVFAGDLISSGHDHIEAGADALAGIKSTYGTWFVMGDHDYWVGTDYIAEAVKARGIHVLQNENALISHHDLDIKITGVTELYSRQIETEKLDSLLEEESGADLHMLLSHQATDRLINVARDSGVHQLLAGHTHGGQVKVRLFFYPVTAVRVETAYVKGNWRLGDMLLNINNGLGFTLSPVRYNAPAQVSVITVQ